ncbi:MAG TPA: FAD-binding oxidoreductase [Bdellovibrionota bacterium]|nr:FAD-binding oxidoreductase [Bdellovibrionota bacterium]
MVPETRKCGTLVVGAGVIGSSVAWHLARLGVPDVRVIDFDLEGGLSSSELNAGGVRATFAQPANIEMSKLTIDYFATVAAEVGYRACGYLWLHGEEKLKRALAARERQQALGWKSEAWDVSELKRRVPFIDKTEGIAGALFAARDGLVNPNRLKSHYREKARALGVVFDDRVLMSRAELGKGVTIEARVFPRILTEEDRIEILSGGAERFGPGVVRYEAERVVNSAGAWAAGVAKLLGHDCPSVPVRRQVCVFDCREVDLTKYGMIVDTSGVYFHPEASNGMSGIALQEPPGINYSYDGEGFFNDHIWPALYERSSAFERLKHLTGWAGLYEVSPDESGIIGQATGAPEGRVFEAHSFSGHGVMHSYAAGLCLAERIAKGRYETFDADAFSGARFAAGREVRESAVI